MKRLINWLTGIWIVLMLTGLIMNNDAGIIVASVGMICAFIGLVLVRIRKAKRPIL